MAKNDRLGRIELDTWVLNAAASSGPSHCPNLGYGEPIATHGNDFPVLEWKRLLKSVARQAMVTTCTLAAPWQQTSDAQIDSQGSDLCSPALRYMTFGARRAPHSICHSINRPAILEVQKRNTVHREHRPNVPSTQTQLRRENWGRKAVSCPTIAQ